MTKRQAQIIILCEDTQQEVFARRFLKEMGWDKRKLRVEKSPHSKGSAEQWVRTRFPAELRGYRQKKHSIGIGLIVMIDADTRNVSDRIKEFEEISKKYKISFRQKEESIAFVIPKRNIETWIHHLLGDTVDETKAFSKLERQSLCQEAVKKLAEFCKNGALAKDAPPSLGLSCREYEARIKPLRS